MTLHLDSKKSVKFDQGNIRLTPPTSGPTANISIFADRSQKAKVEFKKGTNFDIEGTVYVPNGEVKFKQTILDIESDDDEEDEEDLGDADDETGGEYGELGASLIARKVKIDKKSHVRLLGKGIAARRPALRLVE